MNAWTKRKRRGEKGKIYIINLKSKNYEINDQSEYKLDNKRYRRINRRNTNLECQKS